MQNLGGYSRLHWWGKSALLIIEISIELWKKLYTLEETLALVGTVHFTRVTLPVGVRSR